jgi:AraC family transcriptional regulator, transcriptional activator FtrA
VPTITVPRQVTRDRPPKVDPAVEAAPAGSGLCRRRFRGDLSVVPHYAFAEYDATFGGAVDLLVVPYIPYASPDSPDAAVLTWIRDKADAGTTVLSICVGAKAVADASVLGGQTATTHHLKMSLVERTHPEVNWVRGVRYVDSGQFISSAGVTSGVDTTLYTIGRTFGRDVAVQSARTMVYRHLRFQDDLTWEVPGLNPAPYVPNLYRWDRTSVGLMLYPGVRELEISSIIDTYPRAFMTSIRTLAPERTVIRTRHGLDLVPRSDFATAPALDRLLVPGRELAPDASDALQAWAAQHRGISVQFVHSNVGHLYDATLRDTARTGTSRPYPNGYPRPVRKGR